MNNAAIYQSICYNVVMIKKSYKTLDLFAGIGGVRMGFERAGFETVFGNDFDPYCKFTYDLNFKNVPLKVADITQLKTSELPDFDILLGGFPCQPFSIAGYRKGFLDTGRGDLFFHIIRILKDKKPRAVFLENVKNLQSHDNGRTYNIILTALNDLGYHVKMKVLNSSEYGDVPQNRERVYIVGFKSKGQLEAFEFPKPINLTKSVSGLLDNTVDDKYYYNKSVLLPTLKKAMTKKGVVYQWRRRYVRENKSGVCPTLTANMGTGGHNVPLVLDKKGIRKLTPRECARIQGFPDSYKLPTNIADTKIYKQIGNSVTVPVIERVAKQIKKALEYSKDVSSTTTKRPKRLLRELA